MTRFMERHLMNATEQVNREDQVESCLDFLEKTIVSEIENTDLQEICFVVTQDEKFKRWPASHGKHQTYPGGLVVHTAEVLEGCLMLSECQHLDVDKDALVTAVILHDYAKIYDYQEKDDGTFEYADHVKKIRHVSRSYAEFMIMARDRNLNPELTDKIGHLILSHHGRKEWGSPIEPETIEAHILHFSDMLSYKTTKDYYVRD